MKFRLLTASFLVLFTLRLPAQVLTLNDPVLLNTVSSGSAATIGNGLVGYWTVDEWSGSDYGDASGNGWTAAHLGANPIDTNGIINFSLQDNLPASPQGASINSAIDTRSASSPFSFQAWINNPLNRAGNTLAGEWSGALNDWHITYGSNSKIVFSSFDASGTQATPVTHQTALTGNAWTHLVVTFDGSIKHVYLNGVVDNDVVDEPVAGIRRGDSTLCFDADSGNLSQPAGAFDEVGYWNRALTAADVTALYNAGSGKRPSGLVGTITVTNGDFETQVVGFGGFTAMTSASGTWTGNVNIMGNGSPYGNPNAPHGIQAALLQGAPGMTNQMYGLTVGRIYIVKYYAAMRSGNQQTWSVTVDGTTIGTHDPGSSATSYVLYTDSFTATASHQALAIVASNLHGGDNSVFIDDVMVLP